MSKERHESRYAGTNWNKVKAEEKNSARGTTARKADTCGKRRRRRPATSSGICPDPKATLGRTQMRFWVGPTDGVGSDPAAQLGRTHGRSWVRPKTARG